MTTNMEQLLQRTDELKNACVNKSELMGKVGIGFDLFRSYFIPFDEEIVSPEQLSEFGELVSQLYRETIEKVNELIAGFMNEHGGVGVTEINRVSTGRMIKIVRDSALVGEVFEKD